jgi:hypothetical protein
MTDIPPAASNPPERPNPAVEASRIDDEYDRKLHQDAEAAGAVIGTGLGCLGVALIPWVIVILGILAAVVLMAIKKGW